MTDESALPALTPQDVRRILDDLVKWNGDRPYAVAQWLLDLAATETEAEDAKELFE